MSTITQFSTPLANAFTQECIQALSGIAAKYGVRLLQNGGSVYPDQFNMNIKVKLTGQAAVSAGRGDWDQYWFLFSEDGLKKEHFGVEFPINGVMHKVVGIKPERPKYPIQIIRVHDNAARKAPVRYVVSFILAEEARKARAAEAAAQAQAGQARTGGVRRRVTRRPN